MPSEYYGRSSGAFQGEAGATSFSSAYGDTNNVSNGVYNADSTSMCADLAPGGSFDAVSASSMKTGGAARKRRQQSRRRQTRRAGRAGRRRGRQSGGGGAFGRTVLPSKYFGGSTESFVDSPSQFDAFQTAYGTNSATNQVDFAQGVYNRNLGAGGSADFAATSGMQTGGGGRRRKQRTVRRRRSKSRRSSSGKAGGRRKQ